MAGLATRISLALPVAVLAGTAMADTLPACPPKLPDRYAVQALRHERSDERLYCAAHHVARSADPLARRVLFAALTEGAFVQRLGATRLEAVLRSLVANEDPGAQGQCVELTGEASLAAPADVAAVARSALAACRERLDE